MSERELREWVASDLCCLEEHPCEDCGAGHLLLATDPDVVVVARQYRDATPWHPWHGQAQRDLEEQFGFCLLEHHRWEYTDA